MFVFSPCVSTTHCLLLPPPDRPGLCTNRAASGLLLLLLALFQHVFVELAVRLQQLVPPGEGGGVVPDEVHVVEVVEAAAGVERDQVERVQRDVVTAEGEREKNLSAIHSKIPSISVLSHLFYKKGPKTNALVMMTLKTGRKKT